MPSSSICLFFFFFSLLSIHSSFSNTTRQIKWKKMRIFASSRSNCCYTQKKKIFYIERTETFLLHSLFSRTYISSHRPNEQLFFSRKTPKLLQLIIFFLLFFCTSSFMYKYIRIMSVEHTLNVNAEYKLILKMMILDCLTWCNFKGKI